MIHQGSVSVSPNRFSSSASQGPMEVSDLAAKKCVPCNSKDIRPMSEESANALLAQIVEGEEFYQRFGVFSAYSRYCRGRRKLVKALRRRFSGVYFFDLAGHHPDLHLVGWNNLKVELWTHSVGGLTENDFILAAKINSLKVEHLLKRKAAL